MNILHLSDLHFGTLTDANNWYSQLADDLKILNCSKLDILILSGDIGNFSVKKEYDAAKKFINLLSHEFQLKNDHIIIAPGNHDINHELSKKAYEIKRLAEYKGSRDENNNPDTNFVIYKGGDYIEVLNKRRYIQRFKYFANFYKDITGNDYPLDYHNQAILHHFREYSILILSLNSSWQIDHEYQDRVSIFADALSDTLDKIRQNKDLYKNCLKIVVWHHPLINPGEDRIKDTDFMQRLAQAGFCIVFHGHIHKPEYNQSHEAGGKRFDIIGAGTFGAVTRLSSFLF